MESRTINIKFIEETQLHKINQNLQTKQGTIEKTELATTLP